MNVWSEIALPMLNKNQDIPQWKAALALGNPAKTAKTRKIEGDIRQRIRDKIRESPGITYHELRTELMADTPYMNPNRVHTVLFEICGEFDRTGICRSYRYWPKEAK